MIWRYIVVALAGLAATQGEEVDSGPAKENASKHNASHKHHHKHNASKHTSALAPPPAVNAISNVGRTPPDVIFKISPTSATRNVARVIHMEGLANIGVNGGKVAFVPVAHGCNHATPDTQLSTEGIGTFSIDQEPGLMKICYQAPGKTDSVEQTHVKLTLYELKTVKADLIPEIFPKKVHVNVLTDIKFIGAEAGDVAFFVREGSGEDCSSLKGTTPVGAGHNLFTLTSLGTYKLCYKILGAQESAEQMQVSLEVIAQGALTLDMLDAWKSKQGELDCKPLERVSHCGVHNKQPECENTYRVLSGRGYQCYWDGVVFPGRCKADVATLDKPVVCQAGSCGGGPDMCWIGPH